MKKKLFALLTVLCLLFCLIPAASAADSSVYRKVAVNDSTDITAGAYLIYGTSSQMTDNGSVSAFMTSQGSTSTRLMACNLVISDDKVTANNLYCVWNLIEAKNGFYIQNAANQKYLYYGDTTGNVIRQTGDISLAGIWLVVSNNNGWTLQEVSSGRQLSCNRFGSAGSYYLGYASYEGKSTTLRSLEFYKLQEKAENPDVTKKTVTITTQPKTGYAKSGATVKTTVKASGDGLTYQWYVKNAGATKYSKSSITSATYSCTMSDAVKGRRVYCVITDQYGNSVQTKTVLLRMSATITTQPKSVTVAEGATAKVTVKATGDGLTYKWYYKNAGASKFSLTTSFTGNTYSVAMTDARDGRQVYCVITDQYGKSVTSNTVTLRMEHYATITTQPKSVTVAEGKTAKVTVKATGDGLTYKWYYKNAGASKFSLTTSFTGNTYSVSMTDARDGRQVYCVVTDKYGNSVKSGIVTLSMK